MLRARLEKKFLTLSAKPSLNKVFIIIIIIIIIHY